MAYATRVKRELLGVTAAQVVSPDCATQLASGVRKLLDADWALSTTGVAGPDTQDGQPVGTVFVGLSGPGGEQVRHLALEGDRAQIRALACTEAVQALLEELAG